jgi:hypothetical protein
MDSMRRDSEQGDNGGNREDIDDFRLKIGD